MAAARQWLRGGREEVVAPTAMAANGEGVCIARLAGGARKRGTS